MDMENLATYYARQFQHPDVILRLSGVEGPVRSPADQAIVDFAQKIGDKHAYVEDQWHPLMLQSASEPTAVFEVTQHTVVPEGLRSYAEDSELVGHSS